MHYKTIVLTLLQDRPHIYDQLLASRTLLPTLERMATELRTSHHSWQDLLRQANPDSDATQIASEAMELALEELARRLRSAFPPDEMEPLSLDAAMAFISRHSPPA